MADHPVNHDDLTENPMAGYRPVDKPKHCKTMMMPAYTPEQARQRDGGSQALAPTEEMQAAEPQPPMLTVKQVIRELIEQNVEAWKKLPPNVQEALMSRPERFRFYRNSKLPDLIFNGIRFHYEDNGWVLHSVESI